jgi:hypothetical protein
MEPAIHHYYFPYVRSGLAVHAASPDAGGKRNKLAVGVGIKASGLSDEHYTKNIELYGPGDVMGFHPRVVLGTEPRQGVHNFPADHTPYIEFSASDFTWRYSTRKDDTHPYWLPWLSLIVLRTDDEFTFDVNGDRDLPPTITLQEGAVLPDLQHAWRWAHGHLLDVEMKKETALAALQQTLRQAPEKAVSRLLCPRRLRPYTAYTAFVVPTYRAGLQAALGQIPDAAFDELSWEGAKAGQVIPYYYHWQFATGTGGDFEQLVHKLESYPLAGVGKRPIDSSNPGYGMALDKRITELEGALMSADLGPQNGSGTGDYREALKQLLNRQVEGDQLQVVPPIYGQWFVGTESADLDLTGGSNWINELNLNFRHRAAAGLGVQYVKENQDALMQSAWEQLAEIKKVNKAANLGRFSREVSDKLYRRFGGDAKTAVNKRSAIAAPALSETLFRTGLILQTKIRYNDARLAVSAPKSTLQAVLRSSELNSFATSLKIQKYQHKYRFPGDRRERFGGQIAAASQYRDQLVPPTFAMDGLVGQTSPPKETTTRVAREEQTGNLLQQIAADVLDQINPRPVIEGRFTRLSREFRDREKATDPYEKSKNTKVRARSGGPEEEDPLRDVMAYPEFHLPTYRYLRDRSMELLAPGLKDRFEQTEKKNTISLLQTNPWFIESYLIGLNHEFASELRWREFPTDMRGSYFRKFWDTTIYSVNEEERDEFEAAPMGKQFLADISKRYAGFSDWESIEALFDNYVEEWTADKKAVALAFEEAIEGWLLTREQEKEIEHPRLWDLQSALGSHTKVSASGVAEGQMVLLIRGELLEQYPNTLVYFIATDKQEQPDFGNRTFPLFEGHLPPDILFMGFDVPASKAAEYYAVFEEPLTEAACGLDNEVNAAATDDWQNTAWQHFTKLPPDGYLNGLVPSNLENDTVNNWNDPSVIAKIFTQRSVRLVIPLELLIPQNQ